MKKNQLTLLDLVLEDSEEIPQHRMNKNNNPLGISLLYQANKSNQYVSHQLFQTVLQNIEDKLYEFERRLDNKDNLLGLFRAPVYINKDAQCVSENGIQKQESSRDCPIVEDIVSAHNAHTSTASKFHKNHRSKSSYVPMNFVEMNHNDNSSVNTHNHTNNIKEESIHSRLNIFEKKIFKMNEQVNKLIHGQEQFTKQVEQKLQQALKEGDLQLCQNQKGLKEYTQTFKQTIATQQDMEASLHQMREQMIVHTNYIEQIQNNVQFPFQQMDQTIRNVTKQHTQYKDELSLIREWLGDVENDLLAMLKNYKDLLIKNIQT